MFSIFPEHLHKFTPDVEERASTYIEHIYNEPPDPTMSPEEAVSMLKAFTSSTDQTERDVLLCVLYKLLEDFKFFPRYQDRELQISAQIFGGMIEHNIITHGILGLVLHYVLEALQQQTDGKMFNFGVATLEGFKTKMKDYPEFCKHMIMIPHFLDLPSHLIEMNPLASIPLSFAQNNTISAGPPGAQSLSRAMANLSLSQVPSETASFASIALQRQQQETLQKQQQQQLQQQQQKLQQEQQLKLQQEQQQKWDQEQQLRLQQEQQLRQQQEQQLRLQQEQQLRQQQEQQLRQQQEQQLKQQQEQQLRLQQEQQLLHQQQEQQQKLQQEQLRLQQEQQLRQQQEQQLRLEQEQQLRLPQEQQLRLAQEQQQRLQQEQQLRQQQEQQQRLLQEQQQRLLQERQMRLLQEQQLRLQQELQLRLQQEFQLRLPQEHQLRLQQEQLVQHQQLVQRQQLVQHLHLLKQQKWLQLEQQRDSVAESGNPTGDVNKTDKKFDPEIEGKVTPYFQMIFNKSPPPSLSVNEVLYLFMCWKFSGDETGEEMAACAVNLILEEVKYAHMYSIPDLKIMAQLCGGIIEYSIVTDSTMNMLLRYILEALQKPPGDKMFRFGFVALERMKDRLKDCSSFCQALSQIPHIMLLPSPLVEYVHFGARSLGPEDIRRRHAHALTRRMLR